MADGVLITGATGYIGRHVAQRLTGEGLEVLALDRRSLAPVVLANKRPEGVASSVLIHLAGVAGRTESAVEEWAAAAAFARRSIACANAMGASMAILGSSIYATLVERGIASPYGAHKLEIERIFRDEFHRRLVILRLPPIYGGDNDRSSIATLGRLVRRGVPLPLGLAIEKRDYLAMDNLVQLISKLIEKGGSALAEGGSVMYEPSDGIPVSTRQLIRHLGSVLGRYPLLLPIPASAMRLLGAIVGKGDTVQAAFAPLCTEGNGRLAEEIGWVPEVTMPASLEYLLEFA